MSNYRRSREIPEAAAEADQAIIGGHFVTKYFYRLSWASPDNVSFTHQDLEISP
jgi:hypothetical protein